MTQNLPFGRLQPYRPRRFLPASVDLGDWSQLEPLFAALDAQIQAAHDAQALEQLLIDWGELSAAIEQEGSLRYIAMTCHTEDTEAEKAYLDFVEEIEPRTKPKHFSLCQAYLQHPARNNLRRPHFDVFDRITQVTVDLYRKENVSLETEEARLGQQYQKLMGALTVSFRGEERTLTQMGRFLEETDRPTREEAWTLIARRRLAEADRINDLFDPLLELREQIAANAGFTSARDYAFRSLCRFDYSPEDCERFHSAVETTVMPLVRQLQARRKEQLRLTSLRPWDLSVDPDNRPPLRPFEQTEHLANGTQRIFDQLHPELADDFRKLTTHRLLDLDNRKGKAPGGYQSSLAEARLPFIFMNAVGQQRDVETLLHEAGHAFHALACAKEDFFAYRGTIPIEFCEVASMTMELLGNEHLETFYPPAEARRARRMHLEGIISILAWIAAVDAFQHWIYTHPGHSRPDRQAAWLKILSRFQGETDWQDLTDIQAHLWHRQLHIFLYPFYYIEYGIAQLGALQLWHNAQQDRPAALEAYRRALALGGSRPLPDLFRAAGCQFDFTQATLQPLMHQLEEELKSLADA